VTSPSALQLNHSVMSDWGQSRYFDRAPLTSGLARLADILRVIRHVSKVPLPDSCTASKHTPFDLLISCLTWPLRRGRVA
jgi:hypothetical protein